MDMDLRGRLGHTTLPKSNYLLPVFEAIINSIHAIEDAGVSDGWVKIEIVRDRTQKVLKDGEKDSVAIPPIVGFVVTDNGVGFNEVNFSSFKKADSTLKMARGGKGVGRFLWLLAFKKAEVESVFLDGKKLMRRSFEFLPSEVGIENPSLKPAPDGKRETAVRLLGYKKEFADRCPKTAAAVSRRIVEHCLEYFIQKKCPSVILNDPAMEDVYDLNRLFKDQMLVASQKVNFALKGEQFQMVHVMVVASQDASHSLQFCAHHRSVKSENAVKLIPNLEGPLRDADQGRMLTYAGYVSGDFLDKRVIAERTRFDISETEPELDFPDELSWEQIIETSVKKAKAYLTPYTESLNVQKRDGIREYVMTKAPQYRPLLKYRSDDIDDIPAGLTDEKLDLALYAIDQKHDAYLREEYHRLLAEGDEDVVSVDNSRKELEVFLEEWNESGMSKLARHVAYRKATIAFFRDRLNRHRSGKYCLEETIHEIICPLRKSSEDLRADRMNLWLLDERLAYHHYLASDLSFKQMQELDVQSDDRPDVLIFNHPIAFTESETPIMSAVIIEFKRPMRDDYTEEESENPINQVYGYAEKLRDGTLDHNGRPLKIAEGVPLYAYIVCDLTGTLRRQAKYAKMTITPDQEGFFGYHPELGLYVEIISFKKLADDAERRNAKLFEELGLIKK